MYFLIEDDVFPVYLPPVIETINVSDQTYFSPDGPNYNRKWTYMTLMKVALHRIFPELDRVVYLDIDTIVLDDINPLWDLPLGDCYFAGVLEPKKTATLRRQYINAGVAVLNLERLRSTGKGDELIYALDHIQYKFCEQTCISERCSGWILEIPSDYNANEWTEPTEHPKIIHYAAVPNWQEQGLVKQWRETSFEEVLQC